LIHDGETGLLYRVGSVNQLADKIHFLATNSELTKNMGRAGWEMVRREHAPQQHYQKLMGLYDRLLAGKSRRSQAALAPADRVQPGKPRLRVAFIGGRGVISKYSGIESYYEEVGKRLAAMGYEVTVYCRNHFTPNLSEHNGMKLVRLPTLRSKHLETVIHTLLSTSHALTRRYDLVHYHALGPALFSFLPRLRGVKTAVTVQGLDWQRRKWGRLASAVLRLGEKASVHFPNGTMVVSRALQTRYHEQHGVEAFYVPNGGALRERKEPHAILQWGLQPAGYVLYLGRFSPEKGCHLLVEAFEQIETNAKLVMAGGSTYCDEYSRELRTHASDRILMLEWVSGDALDELITNAMVFVLPSDLEGLSLALLDAMGAGLCVLTSDVPENREVVDGAGFTFERGNAADLADRLRFLIANPSVREAAGRSARKRIEDHYQWQKIAEDIESVYLEILGRKPAAVPDKKPSSTAAISSEDPSLQRRAG
jgi:glycosyltransferase involved in cell wall biosynthesis